MGQVVPSVKAPNLGREVALGAGLPKSVPAHTVNRACASANQAIADVASAILLGHVDVGHRRGGGEPVRRADPAQPAHGAHLVEAQKASSLGARLGAFARAAAARPRAGRAGHRRAVDGPDAWASRPRRWRRRTASRGEEQDEIALASHRNGGARDARTAGCPPRPAPSTCRPPTRRRSTADNLLRKDTSMEALAALPPVFDRRYGTVTAGNSSPLTDGAAAVLLMSEERAQAEGYEPLAFVRSLGGRGGGPRRAAADGPRPRDPDGPRAGGPRSSRTWTSSRCTRPSPPRWRRTSRPSSPETWAREKLGRSAPVGRVDRDRLNVCGGSIALGHPFGATGARITTTLANEMKRRDAKFGLALGLRAGRAWASRWCSSDERERRQRLHAGEGRGRRPRAHARRAGGEGQHARARA